MNARRIVRNLFAKKYDKSVPLLVVTLISLAIVEQRWQGPEPEVLQQRGRAATQRREMQQFYMEQETRDLPPSNPDQRPPPS